jgi:GGDEF domain-containing protein
VGYRGESIACNASYGSALFPEDTRELGWLLEIADGAMYRHKRIARAGE